MQMDEIRLFEAIDGNDIQTVRILIKAGVNVNVRTPASDGWTPLLEAVRGSEEIVDLLLRSGADPNIASFRGYTPLMRAAGHGCEAIIRMLIAANAKLDAVDDKGQSALDMAYAEGFPRAAAILEEALGRRQSAPPPSVSAKSDPSTTLLPPQAAVPAELPFRVTPIFVSSTFRDMHVERDMLRDVILPELQERLNQRRVVLELVDLRWGVDTQDEQETLKKNLKILKVCFHEIERSRPYFISLLGDRYGWIPPLDAAEDAAKEAGLVALLAGASLTELEILFFLQNRDEQSHFFCYIRDSLPYQQLVQAGTMLPEKAATYSSEFLSEPERTETLKRLGALKERLLQSGRAVSYPAQWNSASQAVDGLQVWKDRVLADLWSQIDKETAGWAEEEPQSWQEFESQSIERYLEEVRSRPEVRQLEMDAVAEFALQSGNHDGKWARCVVGEPGAGKSSLLASTCRRLEEKGVFVLSHFVGLTQRSSSALAMYQRWSWQLQKLEGSLPDMDANLPPEEVVQRFWRLLRTASIGRRIVLVIDGVEGFGSEDRLNWYSTMASTCPLNVRVILSSDPESVDTLRHRSGVVMLELGALSASDVETIANWICRKYHRQAPRSVLPGLLARQRPDGRPAIQNVRWLSIVVEELNLLGREEFEEAERTHAGSAEARLQQLLEVSVREFPPTVQQLYQHVIRRSERLDPECAPVFLKLLALTRSGLGGADIPHLLESLTGDHIDAARSAFLRRIYRPHLRENSWGLFEFIDKRFAVCVAELYHVSEAERTALHAKIASYLGGLPAANPLRKRELMFQVLKSGNTNLGARLWAETLAQGKSTEDWAAAKWATLAVADELANRGSSGIPWVASVLKSPSLSNTERCTVIESFYDALEFTLLQRLALPQRRELYATLYEIISSLSDSRESDVQVLKGQLGTRLEVGKIDFTRGALPEAVQAFQDALKTVAALRVAGAPGLEKGIVQGEAMAHEHLGRAFAGLGRVDEAIAQFQAAIAVQEGGPPSGERDRQIAHYLIYLGEIYSALRRFDKSLESFQEACQRARLVDLDVDRAERELTISLALEREGDLRLKLDDLGGAEKAFDEVRKIRKRLLDFKPSDLSIFNEAVSSEKLGDVLARRGKVQEARAAYEAAKTTYASLSAIDPSNVVWACAVATAVGRIGSLERQQQHILAAKAAYAEQLQMMESIRRLAPENADVLRRHLTAILDLGDVYMYLKESDSAERLLIQAAEIAETLRRLNPGNATAIRDLGVVYVKLAILAGRQEKHAAAVNRYKQCIELLDEGLKLAPGDRRMQLDKAGYFWNMGQALIEMDKHADAFACLQESHRLYRQLAQYGGLPSQDAQIFGMLCQMMG
jgi:tetratricopeptide (TPR) repeat protein